MSRIAIGSFNVLNLKTDARNDKKADFKNEKVKRIASIIRRRKLDIVCLQEIQSDKTVSQLVHELNSVSGGYEYVHCASIYEELSEDFPYKSDVHSELALVWNSRVVKLEEDLVVYKGIHDSMLRAIDGFVKSAAAVLLGVAVGAMAKLDVGDKRPSEKIDEKRRAGRTALATGSTALSGCAYIGHEGLRAEIEGVLRNTLRPPLVGLFKLANGGSGENVQLRVINVHSQFAKTKYDKIGGVMMRKQEAAFVLNDIFRIVESQRDGEVRTVRTIVCGDFNLKTGQLEDVLSEIAERDLRRGLDPLKFAQRDLTTLNLVNRSAVRAGKESPVYEKVNDYDHFVFRSTCWNSKNAAVVEEPDLFYIGSRGSPDYKPISDHLPICITSDMI